MLIFLVILLSVLLTASVVVNVLLWRAGERQLVINEIYANWISDWREQVFKVWAHMKLLDDKQMFEKDDDVGVVFQDMKILIQSLNDRTEETTSDIEEE
jgi:hypothetical protein